MKFKPLPQAAAILAACALLVACSLDPGPKMKKFVVVDKPSGRTLSTYSYAPGAARPSEIHSYGPDRRLVESHYLVYDAQNRLVSDSLTKTSAKGSASSSLISYSYDETVDDAGKLARSVQTSSSGQVVETYYGFDETGKARGVVQKAGDTLIMKDYPQ
jgi:hypothetical protein